MFERKAKRNLCCGCGAFVFKWPFNRCEVCRVKDKQNGIFSGSKRVSYILEQKNKPCTDCHLSYPSYVMDFDHLPQYKKSFAIGQSIPNKKTLDQIIAEIAKCELVCANCHRIRTHNRGIQKQSIEESML